MTREVDPTARRAEARRSQILQATIEQVILRGIGNVRVQDVASSLGLSTGLIHYHFDTKESLVAQAFEAHGRRSLEAARDASRHTRTAVERLNVLLGHYGPTGDAAGWRVWIDGWSEALHNAAMRQVIHDLDRRWHQEVVTVLDHAHRDGELAASDTHSVARHLLDAIDGLSIRLVVHAAQEDPHAWANVEVAVQARLTDLINNLATDQRDSSQISVRAPCLGDQQEVMAWKISRPGSCGPLGPGPGQGRGPDT